MQTVAQCEKSSGPQQRHAGPASPPLLPVPGPLSSLSLPLPLLIFSSFLPFLPFSLLIALCPSCLFLPSSLTPFLARRDHLFLELWGQGVQGGSGRDGYSELGTQSSQEMTERNPPPPNLGVTHTKPCLSGFVSLPSFHLGEQLADQGCRTFSSSLV